MRITIETQNEGRIILEPEKLGETKSQLQGTQEAAIDGGPPSADLMNAITGMASSVESEEMEEDGQLTSMEETSSFH